MEMCEQYVTSIYLLCLLPTLLNGLVLGVTLAHRKTS
jgi:hypothetical protein